MPERTYILDRYNRWALISPYIESGTIDGSDLVLTMDDGSTVTITGLSSVPSPPTGPAGGDLSGTYPNPEVQNDSHSHTAGTLPATIIYQGTAAGGDLSGTYPNPQVVNDSHSHTASTLPADLMVEGDAAGGDLSGTYPNPSVVNDSHNHTASTLPATIVYDGDAAGGDLDGTYPNPTIASLRGHAVSNTVPDTGYVLTWNGVQWEAAEPSGGGGLAPRYENYTDDSIEVEPGNTMLLTGGLLNGGGVLNGGRMMHLVM